MKVQPRHAQANILLAATLAKPPPYTRRQRLRLPQFSNRTSCSRWKTSAGSVRLWCRPAQLRGDRRQLGGSE